MNAEVIARRVEAELRARLVALASCRTADSLKAVELQVRQLWWLVTGKNAVPTEQQVNERFTDPTPRIDRAKLNDMLDVFGRESRSFVLGRVNHGHDDARRAILDYCCPPKEVTA